MNINISFKPDETTQCLWTEVLPLHELGQLEITRASHIEFNNADQKWTWNPFVPEKEKPRRLCAYWVEFAGFTACAFLTRSRLTVGTFRGRF